MDKKTFSNYGLIVVAVVIVGIMIAFATPFGKFVVDGVKAPLTGMNNKVDFDQFENIVNGTSSSNQLAAPQNLRMVGTTLYFDAVPNASGYVVKVDEIELPIVPVNYIDLSAQLADADDEVVITVAAVDESGTHTQSASTGKVYTPPAPIRPAGIYTTGTNTFAKQGENDMTWEWISANLSEPDENEMHITLSGGVFSAYYWAPGDWVLPSTTTEIEILSIDCGIENLTIPVSVVKIDAGSINAQGITYQGTAAQWLAVEKGEAYDNYAGLPVTCADAVVLSDGTICALNFGYNTELVNYVIPNGVTCLGYDDVVGAATFEGCTNLETVTMPKSVTDIYTCAFGYCESLTQINYAGTKAEWNAISKNSGWAYGTNPFTVVCSDGNIELDVGSETPG